MASLELLFICISAFIAVFVLLAVLALVMRVIIILFPGRTAAAEAVVYAAVASAISTVYPGTKITKIEELK